MSALASSEIGPLAWAEALPIRAKMRPDTRAPVARNSRTTIVPTTTHGVPKLHSTRAMYMPLASRNTPPAMNMPRMGRSRPSQVRASSHVEAARSRVPP